MSCGGVFKLVANDGKADRMILATQLLNTRMKDIMIARRLAGKSDFTPTLPDLERTHILYMNAHFKPYAAIGFEYNKIKPQSGTPTLGTQMTFSIPQFGDFFYDMVCHIVIPPFSGSPVNFPTTPPLLWDPSSIVIDGASSAPPTDNYNPFFSSGAPTVLTGSFVVKNMTSPYGGVLFPGGNYNATTQQAVNYAPLITNGTAPSNTCICGILQYAFVDCFGVEFSTNSNTGLPNVPVNNFVRYCEYPGNFIISSAKFDVNGNPLDSYDQYVSIMQEKYWITPNKRVGYNRLVGQQNPIQGQGGLISASVVDVEYVTASSNTSGGSISANDTKQNPAAPALHSSVPGTASAAPSAGVTGYTALNAQTAATVLNPQADNQGQTDYSQNMLFFTNGPQTPKQIQPPLDLWIKLNFWFNTNVSLAVPSVSIPFGQRFITINLAAAQGSSQGGNLIYEYPAAFLRTTFTYNANEPWVAVTPPAEGSPSVLNTTVINYYAWSAENGYLTPGGSGSTGSTTTPSNSNPFPPNSNFPGITFPTVVPQLANINSNVVAELYINNIFVNPEIHDIYIKRIGFSLIRVFREQIQPVSSGALSDILLSQLKWPIEYMFIALQPTWNTNTTYNTNAWRDWHRMTKQINSLPSSTLLSNHYSQGVSEYGTPSAVPGTSEVPLLPNTSNVTITQEAVNSVQYWLPVPTIDTMSITSHGIQLFDHLPAPFYNTYMPYNFGTPMMNTPEDLGVMFVTFALYPGNYQPSGHLNISRARETYVNITSTYVSQTNGKVTFIAVAIAINFLLISDGSAVLRYST
jgi:hypothetical protein